MKNYLRILSIVMIIVLAMSTVGCRKKDEAGAAPTTPVYINQVRVKDVDVGGADVNCVDAEYVTSAEYICEPRFAPYTQNGVSPEDTLQWNTEEYNPIIESSFMKVATSPRSTFAIDVDNGSYTNFRRMITQRQDTIPSGAIRTEEFLNYFDYAITSPRSDGRFTVTSEIHPCPWNEEHGLMSLLVTANPVEIENRGNNYVFLIDTSGSMGWSVVDGHTSLQLAVESFKLLTDELTANDTVSIVTYAGSSDTVLSGCSGAEHDRIKRVLSSLSSNGGTNGSGGINAAYECAVKYYIEGGNNRVILASDGDMNLGITSQAGLTDLIKEKKELGVFLTTLGFGEGNYSDANMERIADLGNGNYYYIDCLEEARRVLVEKLTRTTVTVAKDVKLQAEFNPSLVSQYRLLGYENRALADSDFKDDTKDGGEVGAGSQVMVLYELIYPGEGDEDDSLKYQTVVSKGNSDEYLTMSIRYKEPDADTSVQEDYAVCKSETAPSADWLFAAGIAELTGILHGSTYFSDFTYSDAEELLARGTSENAYRLELVNLVQKLNKGL